MELDSHDYLSTTNRPTKASLGNEMADEWAKLAVGNPTARGVRGPR